MHRVLDLKLNLSTNILTATAASRMNIFAASPQMAGTVITKSMSVNKMSLATLLLISVNKLSFRCLIQIENTSIAFIALLDMSLISMSRCSIWKKNNTKFRCRLYHLDSFVFHRDTGNSMDIQYFYVVSGFLNLCANFHSV